MPICFNSQRDGILRLRARISHALQVVSIPNGMEFYSVPLLSDIWLIGFQFPTGWNSTKAQTICHNTCILFQFPTGWNSTAGRFRSVLYWQVSIPNGMEFYPSRVSCLVKILAGFNSQRDGILPILRSYYFSSTLVSIPNGMEFYYFSIYRLLFLPNVSIPNGMEFYTSSETLIWSFSPMFQFPTGWNSTLHSAQAIPFWRVSIPNGMEFYQMLQA